MASTLKAMKRVQEIQQVREKRFYEKRYLFVLWFSYDRMALAKEQQRLQKKIIIARVRLVFIHLICRMLNYCVLLLLRRLRMFSEQNKLEKTSRLARPKSFANAKAKTRDSMAAMILELIRYINPFPLVLPILHAFLSTSVIEIVASRFFNLRCLFDRK